ncbi:MAG: TRAP transporter large permease subunit, partial [Pseudomonadota bacterium]
MDHLLKKSRADLFQCEQFKTASRPHQIFYLIICAFGLWHIATNLFLNEPGFWQNAIHFAGFAACANLAHSCLPKQHQQKKWAWIIDIIISTIIVLACLWVAANENDIYQRTLATTGQAWQFNIVDWIAGLCVIFAAIDLTRRMTGWVIPILVILSLSYILFLGSISPGIFRTASLPVSDILFRSLYNDEGMFGIITTISSTNITLFMIFGGFLVVSGASDFVIELSKIVAGKMRGGAAFVAILSSSLTGTISGSA